ncbi:MAG: phosphoribosylamine--glycine ligase [Anaerolineae bacterium]|nr:phosphoribosylamine--glycine ligase [Anaerolineae bacterium]MCB0242198.1 phosphoribosylamine--glycine ligase [Anaerolineae bacterium]MCB0251092.1 phosphoribosylamine--glycine ligase [Anaerolineae bacterium]
MTATLSILVIGNGGREHALAWKLAQSPRVTRVLVAPGNGGTALAGGKVSNAAVATDDIAGLKGLARAERVDLTVIGPEAPLAAGAVDAFQAAGLRCFGPTRAAAQLEASKAFSKAFMLRHGIPTARFAVFTSFDRALAYTQSVDFPIVIKASGLAAGKGVLLPETAAEAEIALRQIMTERAFGAAGDEVVIEERLVGPEASLLAFSDGRSVALMPAAQDHKRVFDGDLGPNTGGMGAYAPAPVMTAELIDEARRTVLKATIDGMRVEGTPYIGILYAGLMLTTGGIKVLEFNCRFGDPETQVILPLLADDLLDVFDACLDGTLDQWDVRWREGATATVVAASEGYPGPYPKGREITGLAEAEALSDVAVFHAGTTLAPDGRVLTDGGRVLAVTATDDTLPAALDRAYDAMGRIHFPGMHYRRDIGANARIG